MEVKKDPQFSGRLFVAAPELDSEFEVWGNCPVQAIGTVLGRDLYFRARHSAWSFDVADRDGNLPSDGFANSDGFYRDGKFKDAGWMPAEKALEIIIRCLEEFTGAVSWREQKGNRSR